MTVSRWGALGSAGLAIVLFFPLAKALFGVEEQESLLRAMSGDVVVLRNTLVFAVTVAVLATLVAWGCAHGERHHDYRGRKLAHLLCLAPLVLPPPVLALAVLTLWGHNGVVTRLFAPQWDVYGLPGLTLAATGSAVPLAYVILRQALDLRDHRLMETSRDLGASSWRVLWTVEWPVIRPAMVVAFLVVFGQAVSNLADPLVLGGGFTVLSTRLFESVTAENDVISAGACAILLVSTGIGAAVVAGL
ncbi:iron ABC transporter permease, partial [Austwickia sp. TVS 96-490-7B]|uniref:ABC transporter permease n=1 Tax=Austwickia sp. TVS 96-490-7B TaxID=2830843 RepID=UPI001C586E5D